MVLHLTVAAMWLGSMAYSLVVVQPRVTRFFPDEADRERFLLTLAHGNRRPVLALVAMLIATAAGVLATAPALRVVIGYAVALGLYGAAAGIFADVSWRHWPARIFALPRELASFRRGLRVRAWAMLCLVGTAFVTALSVSV